MAEFDAEVSDWVRKSQARMLAIFKTSVQYLYEDVVSRTPVDTGYLRASFTLTENQPMRLNGVQGDGYVPAPYVLTLLGLKIGDTVYGSFVANYAPHVEYGARGRAGVGMVRLSVQRWQVHVNNAVRRAIAVHR